MAGTRWTGKRRALVIATFTLACVAFLGVAAPNPVSISELGSNWQCNKTAFRADYVHPDFRAVPVKG